MQLNTHTHRHRHTHRHTQGHTNLSLEQCLFIPVLFSHFLEVCDTLISQLSRLFCSHRTGRHKREDSGSKEVYREHFQDDVFNEKGWNTFWRYREAHLWTFLSVLNVLSHQGCSVMSFMLHHCRNTMVTCPSRSRLCRREALSPVGMCCSLLENTDPECYWLTNWVEVRHDPETDSYSVFTFI